MKSILIYILLFNAAFCVFSPIHANSLYVYYVNGKKVYTNAPPNHVKAEKKTLKSSRIIVQHSLDKKQTQSPPQQITELIHSLAPKYNVSVALAKAVIKAESNFDPLAVSKKGAQGLMQLMPKTAAQLQVENSFDPEQNIRAGLKLLRTLLSQYQDMDHALAAYNAGTTAVNKYKGVPPYQETIDYIKKVRQYYAYFETSNAATTLQSF
ncbi:MAG TPA: lytic transglycosylase domain-containing protein [Oligoflexia bacterium]|nr:lytic transglycosylase domain-containing protein [Oligoflexia bacterium]HMR24920.1 lytic transglycosylase domain-containing protein [Oligoflexia bacterium]